MKPTKPKTCKAAGCENVFTPFNSLQAWCSPICGARLALEKIEKKKTRERMAAKKKRRSDNAKCKRDFLENDPKHVKKQAKAYCHRWIRWRDHGTGICFACRSPMDHLPARAIHAMHFRSSGQNSAIRYNEDNLRLGCYRCNTKNGGNLIEYERHLVTDLGREKVEWLKAQNKVKKWTIEELREVRDDYKERLKALDIPLPSIV